MSYPMNLLVIKNGECGGDCVKVRSCFPVSCDVALSYVVPHAKIKEKGYTLPQWLAEIIPGKILNNGEVMMLTS